MYIHACQGHKVRHPAMGMATVMNSIVYWLCYDSHVHCITLIIALLHVNASKASTCCNSIGRWRIASKGLDLCYILMITLHGMCSFCALNIYGVHGLHPNMCPLHNSKIKQHVNVCKMVNNVCKYNYSVSSPVVRKMHLLVQATSFYQICNGSLS